MGATLQSTGVREARLKQELLGLGESTARVGLSRRGEMDGRGQARHAKRAGGSKTQHGGLGMDVCGWRFADKTASQLHGKSVWESPEPIFEPLRAPDFRTCLIQRFFGCCLRRLRRHLLPFPPCRAPLPSFPIRTPPCSLPCPQAAGKRRRVAPSIIQPPKEGSADGFLTTHPAFWVARCVVT